MRIKAHIIPEWMYGPLYDSQHKIFSFKNTDHPSRAKRVSLGDYDKDILCESCDKTLGKFEDYGSTIFKGGKKVINIQSENGTGVVLHHISGVDYNKFKLFLLSLLWKASISKRPTYENLKLQESDENKIKMMILTETPGDENEYPISISAFHSPGANSLRQLILAPYSNSGLHIFYVAGYLFVFANSKERLPNAKFCLFQTGEITIPAFAPDQAYDILKKLYGLAWLIP